jgi:hypothetical protein
MATLRVSPIYTIELTVEELRLIHRGLHILSSHQNKETATDARMLASKLATDRKYEFSQRAAEMDKLLGNIDKGALPPKGDRELIEPVDLASGHEERHK